MRPYRLFIYLGLLLSLNLYAGKIKTISVGPYKMGTVYLSTGRSTVLTFKNPPKKIIVGNSNYFNVEFTGIDVTIQPLSNVESNMFIYTEKNRYGVLLKAGNPKKYDDLVYLNWGTPRKVKKKKTKKLISVNHRSKRVLLHQVTYNQRSDLYLIDFEIQNLSKKRLKITKAGMWITRNRKMLPLLEKVQTKEIITSGESTRVRLITRLKEKRGFTAHFRVGKSKLSIIVPRILLL